MNNSERAEAQYEFAWVVRHLGGSPAPSPR